jgi:D-aspartate ligase
MPTSHAPTSEPPALVFGGDVSGLAVLRSLGRNGVPVFAAGISTKNLTRSRWYRPAPGEALEETSDGRRVAAYLGTLPFPQAVLIPASDEWALALATLPKDVARRYPATVASERVLRTVIDKERFALAAEQLDVPAPRTVRVTGVESLGEIADADLPNFFLKPRNSQSFARRFGVKALRLAERRDAAELLGKVASERHEVVLQEFIPGPPTAHVFLDGYVDRSGVMRACLARRRLRMHPAEFGNSTLSVTIPIAEVSPALESLRRLFEGIGFVGFFDAEFKHDARTGASRSSRSTRGRGGNSSWRRPPGSTSAPWHTEMPSASPSPPCSSIASAAAGFTQCQISGRGGPVGAAAGPQAGFRSVRGSVGRTPSSA